MQHQVHVVNQRAIARPCRMTQDKHVEHQARDQRLFRYRLPFLAEWSKKFEFHLSPQARSGCAVPFPLCRDSALVRDH